ncbi:MAG: ATP-binding cassette domain-containing protein [Methylovulum sp.]|uniref:ABC transporter ATP-binding protein n=1 Tax=Methylovulum sp. TaxID=1916980 RepID=UPI00262DC91D|nr:ATP-binding cassette domain-containing protein [Methylovulum sp.]MDD2722449.1 ATP-binding cassette domain-containing protein [Methylovulum sp.]MDD5124501.1 ATP-binding cassette domain-containing protein [Methylovulum sp.]
MNPPILRLHDVQKTFYAGTVNEVRPLRGISLDIAEGAFVMVLGGNGPGKSTLLNALAGSFEIDAGRIELDGQEISDWPEHRRAASIGRIFQNPFSGTAPHMSILDNFSLAAKRGKLRGLAWAQSRRLRQALQERVRELDMDLEARLDSPIGLLSGGQRQALTLLMATWLKPKLLLLDEHTAALDPKSADQVLALTQRVIADAKLTTLMVTHSMQQAVHFGDRIVMMHCGKVLHDFDSGQKQNLQIDDLLACFHNASQDGWD